MLFPVMSRNLKVSELPIEETIWLIKIKTIEGEDGEPLQCLVVHDRDRRTIGHRTVTPGEEGSMVQLSRDLVQMCCMSPMVGKPRRPTRVSFIDASSAQWTAHLNLSDLGIRYLHAGQCHEVEKVGNPEKKVGIPAKKPGIPARMRECCVCRTRGSQSLFHTCPGCAAMLYCSPVCQEVDWSRDSMPGHSHQVWCKTMKEYMDKTDQLRQLPFTFATETTSENFDEAAYQRFLEGQGVYNMGFWKREITPTDQNPGEQCAYGELWEVEDGLVLPVETFTLDEPPEGPPARPIANWEAYYRYRGLRLDSPVAILLQWPLTLYHILANCLTADYAGSLESVKGNTLIIYIVGVEKEVELLPLFLEVGHLLREYIVDIHMFGAEISQSVDKKQWRSENVLVHVHRGVYHKKADKTRKPHLVLGYNAGLAAYPSWKKTLLKIKEERTPAYFTDYCQYSCQCARSAIQGLGVGESPAPIINPFRSPVRKLADENNMPWYSNGFIYHISYPP